MLFEPCDYTSISNIHVGKDFSMVYENFEQLEFNIFFYLQNKGNW